MSMYEAAPDELQFLYDPYRAEQCGLLLAVDFALEVIAKVPASRRGDIVLLDRIDAVFDEIVSNVVATSLPHLGFTAVQMKTYECAAQRTFRSLTRPKAAQLYAGSCAALTMFLH
jgi:hypothetical protein